MRFSLALVRIMIACGSVCAAATWARAQHPQGQPETLQQAWEAALRSDARLDAARWEHAAASADLGAAHSRRRPRLELGSQYGLLSDEPSFRTPGGTFPYQQQHMFAAEARLRLPIDTAGEVTASIDSAASAVARADYELQSEQLEIKRQVAIAYIRILRAARRVDVSRDRLDHLTAHASDAQKLFEHDRIPRNDLLAVALKRSEAQIALLEADNELTTARHAYNRHLLRPLTARIWLAPLAPQRRPLDVESLASAGLQLRPELGYLEALSDELNSRAAMVTARQRPHVHLEGGWRHQENRYETPNSLGSAAVVVNWTPYDGGRAHREAAGLEARGTAARRRSDDLASQIQLQVRTAVVNHRESVQRLEVAQKSVEQAEENLRAARLRYQMSRATSTEVLDAVAWRADAQWRWHQAVYDTVQRAIEAHYAAGDL